MEHYYVLHAKMWILQSSSTEKHLTISRWRHLNQSYLLCRSLQGVSELSQRDWQ